MSRKTPWVIALSLTTLLGVSLWAGPTEDFYAPPRIYNPEAVPMVLMPQAAAPVEKNLYLNAEKLKGVLQAQEKVTYFKGPLSQLSPEAVPFEPYELFAEVFPEAGGSYTFLVWGESGDGTEKVRKSNVDFPGSDLPNSYMVYRSDLDSLKVATGIPAGALRGHLNRALEIVVADLEALSEGWTITVEDTGAKLKLSDGTAEPLELPKNVRFAGFEAAADGNYFLYLVEEFTGELAVYERAIHGSRYYMAYDLGQE